MIDRKIGIFSFFSGAGFLDLGFEQNGFHTLFVNEFHQPFADIYSGSRNKMNISGPEYGINVKSIENYLASTDLNTLKSNLADARKQHDLIGFIGGPPCPDFSVAGKNKGRSGENGKLSGSYVELINKLNPDFFLFENVKGLYRTKKHRAFFDELKNKLISNNYYLTERLVNSIEYGVAQNRDRIILIGFKRNLLSDLGFVLNGSPIIQNFDWFKHTSYNKDDVFKYNWPGLDPFRPDSITNMPEGIPEELTVQHWFIQNDVSNHNNSEHYFKPRAGLKRFVEIQEGDDLKKSYKRLHRWRYSPTAAYGNNEVHLHPYKARRITVAEALAVQSLPSDFIIPEDISLTNMFKSIGNGVPYLLSSGLAKTILDFLFDNPIKDVKESHAKINSI
ncbi:MAG: DNA cytosine methyltransferase [Chitinophagales bacterium]|nr:DNA cytosine methyltransferase [Chitinophagales bacterium]